MFNHTVLSRKSCYNVVIKDREILSARAAILLFFSKTDNYVACEVLFLVFNIRSMLNCSLDCMSSSLLC